MIVCDAANSIHEHVCDAWPTDLTLERAHELKHLHEGCPFFKCAVLFAVTSALLGAGAAAALTWWLRLPRNRGS